MTKTSNAQTPTAAARAVAASVLAAALALPAAPTFAQSGASTSRAGIFNCAATGGRQEVGAVVGGAVGALAGRAIGKDNKTLGTLLGAAVGAAAGSWIGCRLQIGDQEKAQAALSRALAENTNQSWSSATGSGSVELISSTAAPAPRAVDMGRFAPGVMQMASYTHDDVGPFAARSRVNVRAGAGTHTPTVGRLARGERVNVIAEAPGGSWVLIERDGVARGYVAKSLLNRVGGVTPVVDNCKTVRETVTVLGGASQSNTLRACRGAGGVWEVTQI
jgi:uncharacterized protein YidB (DUF937 family)